MRSRWSLCAAVALAVLAVCGGSVNEEDEERLRHGADPEKLRKLLDDQIFVCDGGEVVLPLSAVNDDYCDCEDGTDEYGTSACSNGQFLCSNACLNNGPRFVPSSMVGDGICDCCDCSDEWMRKDQNDVVKKEIGEKKLSLGITVSRRAEEFYSSLVTAYSVFSFIVCLTSTLACLLLAVRRRRRSRFNPSFFV